MPHPASSNGSPSQAAIIVGVLMGVLVVLLAAAVAVLLMKLKALQAGQGASTPSFIQPASPEGMISPIPAPAVADPPKAQAPAAFYRV